MYAGLVHVGRGPVLCRSTFLSKTVLAFCEQYWITRSILCIFLSNLSHLHTQSPVTLRTILPLSH